MIPPIHSIVFLTDTLSFNFEPLSFQLLYKGFIFRAEGNAPDRHVGRENAFNCGN